MVAAVTPKPVNVLALACAAYGPVLRVGRLLRQGALPTALAGITPHSEIQALMGQK